MGMMCNLLDVSGKASDAIILALTPTKTLSEIKQKEKIANIEARNRVLNELEKQCAKLSDKERAAMLKEKIQCVRDFFDQVGNKDEERKISSLKIFHVLQKSIEGPIPSSILLSSKPNKECTEKEIFEKQKQKELRDEILKLSLEKAESSTKVLENLKEFLACLGYELTVELTQGG